MAAEFSFHLRKAGRRLKYSVKSFSPVNSLQAMQNPQWGTSQVPLHHIFIVKHQTEWTGRIHLFHQNREVDRKLSNYMLVEEGVEIIVKKRWQVPGLDLKALNGLAEGPRSSQVVRTQRWPSGTNGWSTVVHSSDQAPRHNSWWALEELAASLPSMTTATKEDLRLMSDLLEMVTPMQGTEWLSAALELWSTLAFAAAPPQTFQMNLRETIYPLGAQSAAVTTDSYRRQSLSRWLFSLFCLILAPQREQTWQEKKHKGCSCIGLVQNASFQEGNVDASQLCPYAGQLSLYCPQQVFLQAFSPCTGAQLSRAPGCVPL